jgi:hypothetical protein
MEILADADYFMGVIMVVGENGFENDHDTILQYFCFLDT